MKMKKEKRHQEEKEGTDVFSLEDKEKEKEKEGKGYAKKLGAKFLTIYAKEDDPKKFDEFLALLVREYIGVGEEIENKNFTLEKPKGTQKKKRKFC